MSDLMTRVREKHLTLMHRTLLILGNIVQTTPVEALMDCTDGPQGWTSVEVLGHLVDADEVFAGRVRQILQADEHDHPLLPIFKHEEMVYMRGYRHRHPAEVLSRLVESRREFIALFRSLTPEQWERSGIHPENGEWTLTDALMQVGHHDINHIEQITHILAPASPPEQP